MYVSRETLNKIMKNLILTLLMTITTALMSLSGEPIKYNTPNDCKTTIQNVDTGVFIEVSGANVVKLDKDSHYFINVVDNQTKSVTMLEKKRGSELILDLFF